MRMRSQRRKSTISRWSPAIFSVMFWIFMAIAFLVAHINLALVLSLAVVAFLLTELLCAAVDRRRPFTADQKPPSAD